MAIDLRRFLDRPLLPQVSPTGVDLRRFLPSPDDERRRKFGIAPPRPAEPLPPGFRRGFLEEITMRRLEGERERAEAQRQALRHLLAEAGSEPARLALREPPPRVPLKVQAAEAVGRVVGGALSPVGLPLLVAAPIAYSALAVRLAPKVGMRLAPLLANALTGAGELGLYQGITAITRDPQAFTDLAERDPAAAGKWVAGQVGGGAATGAVLGPAFAGIARLVGKGVVRMADLVRVRQAMQEEPFITAVRQAREEAARRAEETIARGARARAEAPPTTPERGVVLERPPAPTNALGLPPGGLQVVERAPVRARVETPAQRRARLEEAIEEARAERARLEARVRRLPRAEGGVLLQPPARAAAPEVLVPGAPRPARVEELVLPELAPARPLRPTAAPEPAPSAAPEVRPIQALPEWAETQFQIGKGRAPTTVADEVERLAAARHPDRLIAARLRRHIPADVDALTAVRSIRAARGIPSLKDGKEFEVWRTAYLARKQPPLRPTAVQEPLPPTTTPPRPAETAPGAAQALPEAVPEAPPPPREHPTIAAIRARRRAPEPPERLIETQPVAPELRLAGQEAAAPPVRIGVQETLVAPPAAAGKAASPAVVGQMKVGETVILGNVRPRFVTQFGSSYDVWVRRNAPNEWSLGVTSPNITHSLGVYSSPKALLDRVDDILLQQPTIEGLGGQIPRTTSPLAREPRDYRDVFEKKQVFHGAARVPRAERVRLPTSERKLNQMYEEHLRREAEARGELPEVPPAAVGRQGAPPPAPAVEEFLDLPAPHRRAITEAIADAMRGVEGRRGRTPSPRKIAEKAYTTYLADKSVPKKDPRVTPAWLTRYLRESEEAQAMVMAPPGAAPAVPPTAAPAVPPASPVDWGPVTEIKDLVDYVRRVVPVRWKHLRQRKPGTRGEYKERPEVVRAKEAFDLDAVSHEVGHHLDKHFQLTRSPHLIETAPLLRVNPAAYKPNQIAAEQVAEFTRTWLTDPDTARAIAPNFAREFEQRLATRPEWADALRMAQEGIRAWKEQPARNRILGRVVSSPETPREPYSIGRFLADWEDRLLPLKDAVKKVAQGQPVPAGMDPYKLARRYPGAWAGRAHTWVFGKRTDRMGRVVGPGLEEILQPVRGRMDDLRAFILAQHADTLERRGVKTGFDRADIDEVLRTLRSPDIEKAASRLTEYRNALLDEMADSGFISTELAERFKRRYPHYVTTRRFFEEAAPRAPGAQPARGFIDLPQPIKTIRGSARLIMDPIETDVRRTYIFHALAEANRVGRAFLELAERFPPAGRYAEVIPAPVRAQKFSLREISRLLERAGADLSQADLDRALTIFRPTGTGRTRESIGIVWRDGKPIYVQYDPGVFNALQNMDDVATNAAIRLLSFPASILRAGAVGLNPEWAAPNIIRDQIGAAVYSRHGYIPGVDLVRGIFHLVRKDALFHQYRSTGGALSSIVAIDQDAMRIARRQFLADPGMFERAKAIVLHPIEALRTIATVTDDLTRLGEFARAPRRTFDEIVDAAIDARDVILDYRKAGRIGRDVNRIQAFWNAQVLSLSQFIREHAARPVQVSTRAILGVTVPSVLLYLHNRDDPEWRAAPRWMKDVMWSFRLGEKRIWIPKPFLLGLVYGSIPERILEWIDTQDPAAIAALGRTLGRDVGALVPFWGITALQPPLEMVANYDVFRGRPIIPRSEERLPPRLQYGPYTPTLAVEVGKRIGVSPRKVEHLVTGYGAGVGRLAMEAPEMIGVLPRRPGAEAQPPAERLPVVRRFVRPPFAQAADVDEFYDRYQELQAEVAGMRKEGRLPPATVGRRRVISRHPLVLQLREMEQTAEQLNSIRKMRELVLRSGLSAEEKRQRLVTMDRRAVDLARRALRKPPLTQAPRGLEELWERASGGRMR